MILATGNLYVAPMPPIKFWVMWTYGLGGDVMCKITKWQPWWPSWILERKFFGNSESLCHSDVSHQVSAQSNLLFWRRCCLKNFKIATMAMTYGVREVV